MGAMVAVTVIRELLFVLDVNMLRYARVMVMLVWETWEVWLR